MANEPRVVDDALRAVQQSQLGRIVLNSPHVPPDPLNVAEESLAVTCPHCGHTSDVRIPARFKPA